MKQYSRGTDSACNVVWIEDEPPSTAQCKVSPIPDHTEFTIGELAREFGITLRALRFYENKGFISPRREKTVRLYSQNDRARIAAILAGKKLGFTLAQIRTMIGSQDGVQDADSLRVTKEKCLEQIHVLEQQQLNIKDALNELWRIHAGLSAAGLHVDWTEASGVGASASPRQD